MLVVALMIIIVAREQLDQLGIWGDIIQNMIVSIEVVGVIVFLGLKVAIKLFEGVQGEVLGTQPHYMVSFWRRTEQVVLEMLLYNGFVGVMLLVAK